MEFVTNNNGIRFKVCCASCENRVLEVTGSRCGLVRAKPKPGKQCTAYQFRTSLMDAGKVPPAGLTQIRSEYEKMYGSIYLTP